MDSNTYMVWVKDARTGAMFKATCVADNPQAARQIFEGMYNPSQITCQPSRV